jgi:sec-independent protein translocase protein TatA
LRLAYLQEAMVADFSNLIMGIVNGAEWIIIIAIIAVIIFGAKKIPELARSFGRASTEYEKAKLEANKELQKIRNPQSTTSIQDDREKLEAVAETLGINYSNKNNYELKSAIQAEIDKNSKVT